MGKTRFPFIREGLAEYNKRLKRYTVYRITELPELKKSASWPQAKTMEEEGKIICKALSDRDFVILLDERGESMDSIRFAEFLDGKIQESVRHKARQSLF